eukprot:COSAG05_NODE_991_length_6277_cov_77.221305_1_plen_273_part_00
MAAAADATARLGDDPYNQDATPDEAALLPALRAEMVKLQGGEPLLKHMATVYGGEEWLMLRYLRVSGTGKPEKLVSKAVQIYEKTLRWRAEHAPPPSAPAELLLPAEPAPEPEPGVLRASSTSATAVLSLLSHGGSQPPLSGEVQRAALAVAKHRMREFSPFSAIPRPSVGLVLLCGNIELVDVVPLRKAGLEPNLEFFVTVYEYVCLLQRQLTAAAEGPPRCGGDVAVIDVAALAWKHIDPRLMHRVPPAPLFFLPLQPYCCIRVCLSPTI